MFIQNYLIVLLLRVLSFRVALLGLGFTVHLPFGFLGEATTINVVHEIGTSVEYPSAF